MIRNTDEYLTLLDACQHIPCINGRRVHPSAIWRWVRKGVLARNGERIRLEHLRIGRRLVVSKSAVADFLKRVAAADVEYFSSLDEKSTEVTSSARCANTKRVEKRLATAIDAAKKLCDREGI